MFGITALMMGKGKAAKENTAQSMAGVENGGFSITEQIGSQSEVNKVTASHYL